MKFCFRADASFQIGSGHVIRCLTIADALVKLGHECYFICREHQGNLIEFLRQKGFEVQTLSVIETTPTEMLTEYQKWLGVTEECDAQETLSILEKYPVDWVVIDHYGLSKVWQQRVRKCVDNIVVIDDLANREHDANIILDCGLTNSSEDYKKLNHQEALYLMGPHYALLRPEFGEKRLWLEQHKKIFEKDRLRILVNLGGVDKDNLTGVVLETLSLSPKKDDFSVTVVMGVNAPWKDAVLAQAKMLPFSHSVLVNVNNMADLMLEHDLAIGAAGSTAWERCCLGLPAIMVCMADNQKMIATNLSELGVAISLDQGEVSEKLLPTLQKLDLEQLQVMHQKALTVTDGKGVDLLLQAIFSEDFKKC